MINVNASDLLEIYSENPHVLGSMLEDCDKNYFGKNVTNVFRDDLKS